MGKLNNGITGDVTGRVANASFYIRNGQNIVRSAHSITNTKATPKRVAQREKLKICNDFTRAFSGTGFFNNNWIEYGPWLAEPRNPSIFEGEKILVRKITGKTLIATYVPETSYCNTLLFVLKLKNKDYSYKAILGILNSDLIGWYFRKKFQIGDDDTFPQIMIRDILKFPIPAIEEKENAQIVQLVETILQLHKEKQQTSTPDKLSQLEARIEYTDDKIKQLVFDLYGLSEEERRIVEGG